MNAVPIVWRVVVVEDDPDTRQFLESCVKDQMQFALAGSFASLQPARAWFAQHEADLLLVDLGLPDGSGLQLMREVQQRWPQCDMLVVSMFGDEENVVASIEAGAVGYVHKDDEAADIAQTLLAVKQGASPISPMIARHLLRRMQPHMPTRTPLPSEPGVAMSNDSHLQALGHEPVNDPTVSLTKREQEVLEYIARGFSYAEIARLQGITVHTVQTYIKKLYGKLAVHSRSEAVYEANRLGLLTTFSQGVASGHR
ncbi:response regulator transcription factor [Aquabacterium lacunae]|uniref:Response regulator transcription factor n=1 Tax=Aquabacterium lacunae TaxID=2528630 RepID=A0A4Q9H311_9BURK|nr:response regulator transcription factor [Aquabacterium lacunae]TBO34428.1 response regulator transcription factor [Aquabacterium lacunae]